MRSVNIMLPDDVHRKLLELRDRLGYHNLGETVREAVCLAHSEIVAGQRNVGKE